MALTQKRIDKIAMIIFKYRNQKKNFVLKGEDEKKIIIQRLKDAGISKEEFAEFEKISAKSWNPASHRKAPRT